MYYENHLDKFKEGITAWNEWRMNSPAAERIDLHDANLRGADLHAANLRDANLRGADLHDANLRWADLSTANLHAAKLHKADLSGVNLTKANLNRVDFIFANLSGANAHKADFHGAELLGANLVVANLSGAKLNGVGLELTDLRGADLRDADLRGADLHGADLRDADLSGVDLSGANLSEGNMVRTNFNGANLTGCRIYGVSAWDLKLQTAIQKDLIITRFRDPDLTVDNLEVAQFVYLLINNEKIRDVIDTITSKVVLILGRFTTERKEILDALREELRKCHYSPVLFDLEKPSSRNLTETITLLARMSRFIIADLTDAKSIPQELYAIIPHLPSVPVKPLLISSQKEYGMFESFRCYPWVLETYYYDSIEEILASIKEKIINPAEEKARELSPTISHR